MSLLSRPYGQVLGAIAESDCEELDPGAIAQPFNAWSSLAYVLAGLWILLRRRRWRLDRWAPVFATFVMVEGVGSIAFHGAADPASRWLHDVGFLGLLGFVAGWHVAPLLGIGADHRGRLATIAAGSVVVVGGVLLVPFPDLTDVVAALLVVVAAVSFVAQRIRNRTRPAWSDAPFVAVAAVAGAAFFLGRTGSFACEPDDWFQFHGAWHTATAVLAVIWARGALTVPGPGEGAVREGADRSLAGVVGLVVRGFFREITVSGRDRLPERGPVIIVINHFNGLVDALVAVHALGRLPRFVAKATLWKTTVARPFLALAGLIPVYRAVDRAADARDPGAGNRSAFEACHAVLADGGTVAIFPEGTTSARSRLDKVRTGAARIAIGAYAQGTQGLVIVPMGIAYEDRVAFRGRAYIEVGEPIDVASAMPALFPGGVPVSEDDHGAVDRLTDDIVRGLRGCAPDYDTPREQATLRIAAQVALRPEGTMDREPTFGEVEREARRIARAPEAARAEVETAVADYALDLRIARLTDAEITPGPRLFARARKALFTTIGLVLLSPVIAFGLLANVVPFVLVRLASRRVTVPVTKGTVRMLVSIAVFPITWIVLAAVLADSLGVQIALFVAFAVCGFVAMWALEETFLNARMLFAWRAGKGERSWFVSQLREHRSALVAKVSQAATEAASPAHDHVP